MWLRGLLFFNLLFVVNQVHFPWETHIPALAPTNIIMVFLLLAMRNRVEALVGVKPILTRAIVYFFAALTFGFLWSQLRAFEDFIADATYLKNAVYYPLFYFVYLKCGQDAKWTRYLIIWILVIAAVAGLEAVREGFDYGLGNYSPERRASGPFGVDWRQANRAGVFYAMFLPMFMALALFLKGQKLWRIGAIVGVFLLGFGALVTYSRQSYFLILFGIAVLLLRRSLIVALIVGALLVSLVGLLPDSVTQRVDETSQKSDGRNGGADVDESTSSRWEIWAGAMGMFADHPIGVGTNRFKREIGNYSTHKGFDAHNFYVLTLAETGPQGLIALLYLFGTLFFGLSTWLRQKAPPEDSEAQALAIGFSVMTINTALGGIYGSPTLEGAVMAPYWAMAGLLERYMHLKQMEAAPEAAREVTLADRFPLIVHLEPGRKRPTTTTPSVPPPPYGRS